MSIIRGSDFLRDVPYWDRADDEDVADFPISLYERPSIALANLLEFNPSAAVRSIFAPMQLSPSEMKSLRQKFIDSDNPVMKTAGDLATNPFIMLSVAMSLGPWGKVANLSNMALLKMKGSKHMSDIGETMGKLVSPLNAYRNLFPHGFWEYMIGSTEATNKFLHSFGEKYTGILKSYTAKTGKALSKRDRAKVYMYLENYHRPARKSPLIQHWGQYTGQQPLAPNLPTQMTPELRSLSDKLRGLNQEVLQWFEKADKTYQGAASKNIFQKGWTLVKDGYFPRRSVESPIGTLLRQHKSDQAPHMASKLMSQVAHGGPISPHVKARTGHSLPLWRDIESAQDLLRPEVRQAFQPGGVIDQAESRNIRNALTKVVHGYQGQMSRIATQKAKGIDTSRMEQDATDRAYKTLRRYLTSKFGIDAGASDTISHEIIQSIPQGDAGGLINQMATAIGPAGRYSADFLDSIPAYVRSMSTTYGWWGTGMGPKANAIVEKFGSAWQKQQYDPLMKQMAGLRHPKEVHRSIRLKNRMAAIHEYLHSDVARKMLPDRSLKWLQDKFDPTRTTLSDASLGGFVSGLFYTGALGFPNLSPPFKNIHQPIVTTLPMVGPGGMMKGLSEVFNRFNQYFHEVARHGREGAFAKAFPEYQQKFGYEKITHAMAVGDIAKEGRHAGHKVVGAFDKFKQLMISPHAASEKFNRLWTFYSGRSKALSEGVSPEQAGDIATQLVRHTQFPGGILGMPNLTRGMWAPLRQFTHFPLRHFEFLHASLRAGDDPSKMSLGVLSRALGISAGMVIGGRQLLGYDPSRAMTAEAIPSPVFPGSPFYPFPLVPPFASAVGGTIQALHQGDIRQAGSALALASPGGLGLRRMYQTFHPRFADYDRRTEEGHIPLYNQDGSLIGTSSPLQMALRGLGIPTAQATAERDMTQYLLRQRDQIRAYRRDYLEALTNNNLERAKSTKEAFSRRYPELGELQVKESDVRAVQDRKEMSRIQRSLQGFRKDDRELFEHIVHAARLNQFARELDYDPSALRQFMTGGQTPQTQFGMMSPSGEGPGRLGAAQRTMRQRILPQVGFNRRPGTMAGGMTGRSL